MIATGNHNFEKFAALCNTLSGEPRRLRRSGRQVDDPLGAFDCRGVHTFVTHAIVVYYSFFSLSRTTAFIFLIFCFQLKYWVSQTATKIAAKMPA